MVSKLLTIWFGLLIAAQAAMICAGPWNERSVMNVVAGCMMIPAFVMGIERWNRRAP